MKLYYNDIFSASYMAGTFPDLRWCDEDGREIHIFTDDSGIRWFFSEPVEGEPNTYEEYPFHEYYIHPDCHAFFEPVEWDVIEIDGEVNIAITIQQYAKIGVLYGKRNVYIELECICNFKDKYEFEWWISEGKIIQRNNKPFIMPKMDD